MDEFVTLDRIMEMLSVHMQSDRERILKAALVMSGLVDFALPVDLQWTVEPEVGQ